MPATKMAGQVCGSEGKLSITEMQATTPPNSPVCRVQVGSTAQVGWMMIREKE